MQIIIVNEKDDIIGSKKRGTLTSEDIYRVSALWIENSKGQILLARRVFTKKKDPGMWGPAVAGTLEKGESYESNIIKEAQEELGLTNVSFKKFIKQKIRIPHNHFTQWFLLIIDRDINDFKIKEDEVAEIKWFSKQELWDLIKKNSQSLITSLKNFVKIYYKNG